VYGLLCNEPWCWHPADVGRLTDYQIFELVLRPAARRARRAERDRGPGAALPRRKAKAGGSGLPDREGYVAVGVGTFGMTPEQAGAEWDRCTGGATADGRTEPAA